MTPEEKLKTLQSSLDNKFISDEMKKKIREQIERLKTETPYQPSDDYEIYKDVFEQNRKHLEKYNVPMSAEGIDFLRPVMWKVMESENDKTNLMKVTSYNDNTHRVYVTSINSKLPMPPSNLVSIYDIVNAPASYVDKPEWKEGDKKYYKNSEIKSITVKKDGKHQTFKASDSFNGANFVDKKAKGGTLKSKAKYYKVSDIAYITTVNGDMMKPDNGYWIKNDAVAIFEYGGVNEIAQDSIIFYDASRFENGGKLDYKKSYRIGDYVHLNKYISDNDPVYEITGSQPFNSEMDSYDLESVTTGHKHKNVLPKMFTPAKAMDKQKKQVKSLAEFAGNSEVIDESQYKDNDLTYSWENTLTDQVREGFRSEMEAYADLIRFLEIRKKLLEFYWKIGYEDMPDMPVKLIEKDYGQEITQVQLLIDKGEVNKGLNLLARDQKIDPEHKKYFYKLFSLYSKKAFSPGNMKKAPKEVKDSVKTHSSDGRKNNGNPIFEKAKEIRQPGETWKAAVQRAKMLLY